MILFLAGGALPALSDDAALGQGLVPPSPEALAWERTHMIRAGKIKLNRIGLERVNASRVSNGLSSLSDSQEVAPIGLEVEGSTDEELERLGAPVSLAEGLADLPSAVDNSALKYFPPIRSQGSIGSCAQWTAMYYCFTHMNALVRDLDAKNGTDAVRFSPKFTYNLVNGGVDSGSWPTEGWAIAAQHGAASWQDWPNDSNYRAWPKTAAVWRNALNVRVQTTGSISQCDTPTGMAQLKTLLVNGYVLSYATYISNWQYKTISDDPSTTEDDAHVGKTACYWVNGTTGGHGMTVVGYNDHIWVDINGNGSVDSGEKGAFRIANSWGSGWKDGGFTWIAYDALKRTSGVSGGPSANRTPAWWVGQAMWVTAKPIFNPKALAEITLNHVKRNQIGVSFGLSGTTETVPSTQWFPTGVLRYSGGAYSFSGNATPEDGTFVFDLSDLPAPYGIQKRWYLRVQDNAAGDPSFVKAFKWTNFSDSGQVVKSALPVDLDNAFQFFYVDATLTTGANNTPPTISSVSPVSTDEDTATAPLTFSVGDGETPVSSIAVAGTSNNLSLYQTPTLCFPDPEPTVRLSSPPLQTRLARRRSLFK
ncbi:MAG: C1 family peptidase [Elusimicrobia bacterium]|nr:C1 family peptidase [Elusimicrobiota bacterium]